VLIITASISRQRRFHDRLRVPMVRCADHHGIDIPARDDFAVITVGLHGNFLGKRFLVGLFNFSAGEIGPLGIKVRHGDDAGELRMLQHAWHVHVTRDAAAADLRDLDQLARGPGTEDARGNDGRETDGRDGSTSRREGEELAAIEIR
jgi:hypothetical protein